MVIIWLYYINVIKSKNICHAISPWNFQIHQKKNRSSTDGSRYVQLISHGISEKKHMSHVSMAHSASTSG